MQCAEAHRQNISRERARLAEMQYNLEILRQQGREALLHNQIRHDRSPLPAGVADVGVVQWLDLRW
jgi:hypothetical protein